MRSKNCDLEVQELAREWWWVENRGFVHRTTGHTKYNFSHFVCRDRKRRRDEIWRVCHIQQQRSVVGNKQPHPTPGKESPQVLHPQPGLWTGEGPGRQHGGKRVLEPQSSRGDVQELHGQQVLSRRAWNGATPKQDCTRRFLTGR